MQHLKTGRKLGRTTDHREAMLANMVTSLILHDRNTTTETRAKELRGWADKMITLGRKNDLAAIRQASKTVKDKAALGKLFKELAPRVTARCWEAVKVAMVPGLECNSGCGGLGWPPLPCTRCGGKSRLRLQVGHVPSRPPGAGPPPIGLQQLPGTNPQPRAGARQQRGERHAERHAFADQFG